jgi:membrane fusion protein, multidrug efflux system
LARYPLRANPISEEDMRVRPRWALAAAGIVLASAAAYYETRHSPTNVAPAQHVEAVPVTAGVVTEKDVPIVIHALGTVQPIEIVNVQSRVNGQIMQAHFTQGQVVKKGDPLFLIDPRPYQAALDQAEAQLAHDQALLAEAKTDLARYQKLLKENSIASQQAEDQQFVVQQDEGTVKLDQANVETAKLNLEYAHINAPAAGLTGEILIDPGNYVQAGAGITSAGTTSGGSTSAGSTGAETLVTITQISPIYVSFPMPQSQLAAVRAAQAKGALDTEALSENGKKLGEGKLSFINNEVATTTGTVALEATFPNPDRSLWPGAFVTVNLTLGMRRDALTAPLEAVASGPNGDYVYTISADNVAHRVPVLVVARQNGLAVFTKGVSAGERVVVNGQYNLANGVKVAIEPPKAIEPAKATASAAP